MQITRLPGARLHLHHGPIDMVFSAEGTPQAVTAAEDAAATRFRTILAELVADLPALRRPDPPAFTGETARAMARAVRPHAPAFVTPMAAVAGAVADTVLRSATRAALRPGLVRAYANNGGDAALWLAPGEAMRVAMGLSGDRATIRAPDPVRGVATSGWRGRSHSLGIADAVTVLAPTAAEADVAATLIANAVDLPGSRKIERVPADTIDPDNDLGPRPVTRAVAPLTDAETAAALAAGLSAARAMHARGLIHAAVLYLNGRRALIGTDAIEGTGP